MSLLANYFYKAVTPEMPEQVYYRNRRNEWIKVTRPIPGPKEDPGFGGVKVRSNQHEFSCDYDCYIRKADIDNDMEPCSKEEWLEIMRNGVEKVKSVY